MPATERRRSRRLPAAPTATLAATLAAAALALTGAPPAGAVVVAAGTPSGGAARTTLSTVDEAGQQAALDYWTPERMASALPAAPDVAATSAPAATSAAAAASAPAGSAPAATPEAAPEAAPGPARSTLAAGEAPVVPRGLRSASTVVTGGAVGASATWTGGAAVTPKVGRLYFTQLGRAYECSASSVDSPNGSVVLTAGHCLSENGVASANVIFVPGLAGTAEPFGRWSATKLMTTSQWLHGNQQQPSALNYDVGFAVVAKKGGKSLADTVGTLSIGFDTPLDRVTVFGYPGRGATSDGNTLKYCTGWRFTDTATTDQGTVCAMAGGSSGGPWISGLDTAAGTGTVTSVVSFSYDDAPELLFGPQFGSVVRGVYQDASAILVP